MTEDKVQVVAKVTESRRDKWDEWVEAHPAMHARSQLIRKAVNEYMDNDPLHPDNERKKSETKKALEEMRELTKDLSAETEQMAEELEELENNQATTNEIVEETAETVDEVIEDIKTS